ncbi:fimbrial protein [Paraburkholderia sp. GAS348]|uniref:fimbrial protein n=1 Tax=Paraburkholderia sp. GAS348 TaxID=3035132 RepID=UPI003D1DB2E0
MNQTLNSNTGLRNSAFFSMQINFTKALTIPSRRKIMWKVFGVFFLALVQLTFGASRVHAATVSCSLTSTLNFAPVLDTSGFGRDSIVGGTTPNYSTPVNFLCSGDPNADRDIYLWFQVSSATLVSGYTDLFKTDNPGVGVRYTISNGADTSCQTLPTTLSTSKKQVVCHQFSQPVSPGRNYSVIVSAQFVKLANAVVGAVTTIPSLSVTNGINNQSGNFEWGNVFTGAASGSFSTLTCSVTTPSIPVTMRQANTNRLPSVGSTDGTTSFNIGLNCDPGINVAITLTDATTPSNTGNTLSLAPDSTASGVGYQIVYNGSPVSFGPDSAARGTLHQFSVMASPAAGGPMSIPLTAQFIRTGTVNPGTVKGLATFTMSYQ